MSVQEFIYSEEYCGGIRNGKKLKAVVAGGSSVPILPTELILKTAKGGLSGKLICKPLPSATSAT